MIALNSSGFSQIAGCLVGVATRVSPNLIITVSSHDNPAETITGGDIDVALADITALTDHFLCHDCGRYVEAKREVPGQDKIACKCGKKQMEWKQ